MNSPFIIKQALPLIVDQARAMFFDDQIRQIHQAIVFLQVFVCAEFLVDDLSHDCADDFLLRDSRVVLIHIAVAKNLIGAVFCRLYEICSTLIKIVANKMIKLEKTENA